MADKIYGSWWFIVLWFLLALAGFVYILQRRLQKKTIIFIIHLSFVLILSGALTTYLFGKQGMLHLRENESTHIYYTKNNTPEKFPFQVSLEKFRIVYYPGTPSPMDYISYISIKTFAGETIQAEISINNIFSYNGYRFYQSGYDEDGKGTILAISHDPYGIAITYTGYTLLLLSIIAFFFTPDSRFRKLIKNPLIHRGVVSLLVLLSFTQGIYAAESPSPKILPKEIAAEFGEIYVLYNNRICPLQTLAKDFTTKLYGKPTYRGLSAEQVFTGWMFYYNSWKAQPMIKIKKAEARELLGIENNYAALADFITPLNQYKLESTMNDIHSGKQVGGKRGIEEADEKYNIIRIFYSGEMMKIFPYSSEDGSVNWYSQNSSLPDEIMDNHWFFIKKTQDYIHEMVVKKDYESISFTLQKIKEYQRKEAAEVLPTDFRFNTEKIYNKLNYTKTLAMLCMLTGLLAFFYFCISMALEKRINSAIAVILLSLLSLIFLYLTITISMHWIVSGHVPLSNGYETMQFMAWCSLLFAFFLRKRVLFIPFGFMVCGLTLLVSVMGESNPQITQLIPVLSSPLLSIHVAFIMVAYSLFAFIMLNGIAALIIQLFKKPSGEQQIERLQVISNIMLYPALFCLTIGIFVGAVWANVSWGRYWGWDPKEVWALITILIYSFALHTESLPVFRRPFVFHVFTILAFLSVLITYFGVNFILGGIHSYV